jgi:hypothetical protein
MKQGGKGEREREGGKEREREKREPDGKSPTSFSCLSFPRVVSTHTTERNRNTDTDSAFYRGRTYAY